MAISNCGRHDIIASKRCPVCFKPICIHCKTRDNCCSRKCFRSRKRFAFKGGGGVRTADNSSRNQGGGFWTLVKIAVLIGAALGAARYFGYL
jgi:hypothetical protein